MWDGEDRESETLSVPGYLRSNPNEQAMIKNPEK